MNQLPVELVIPELKEALCSHKSAVLIASPGSGKTTRVPLALLDEPWLAGRKIWMLEPRRLAAKASARFMAALLGEKVGETVGYRVKMDTRTGPNTRIEVMTEGVLTRMLQADPSLEEAGLLIFDEFHERNLHADLGLALVLQAKGLFREDLRVLVMSATLDAQPVSRLLDQAPIIESEGKVYPIETRFLQKREDGRIEPAMVRVIWQALAETEGDILAFLPGAGEIRRVEAQLLDGGLKSGEWIAPLHGSLPQEMQERAIAPGRPGERKIVLATSIAETSLTVEGVRVVIDSGQMRVPRFSPRTGMTRLETITVSRASADQRRGRAGRLGPGVCYRLWTQQEDHMLASTRAPEINEADLAPLALELAAWGVADPAELAWLDEPPQASMSQARELLKQLGALDEGYLITAHGRQLADLGLHPRLGHMIVRAHEMGLGEIACELAALLGERDILGGRDADIRLRVEALRRAVQKDGTDALDQRDRKVDRGVCLRIWEEANQRKRELGIRPRTADATSGLDDIGVLLAFAYPDRIAQRRAGGKFLLSNGRGAAFSTEQPLAFAKYAVAAELDDQGTDSKILLAAEVGESQLTRCCADQITEESEIAWEPASRSVRARKRKRLGAIVLQESVLSDPDPDQVMEALLAGIASEGIEVLPWNRGARQLRERMLFMHSIDGEWPDVSDEGLLATMNEWLAPHLHGCKKREDVNHLQLAAVLESMLTWNQRRELDEYAPTHVTVPSGSRIPIDYSDIHAPVLAVRLQELFGWQETPRIGRGRVPLTIHLLSPAHRLVQVTRDLASFWQQAYFDVKKDLKGRYPKHYWPDDPMQAIPTNRTKPRS